MEKEQELGNKLHNDLNEMEKYFYSEHSLCAAIRISVIRVMLDLNLIFLLLQMAYQYNSTKLPALMIGK